MLPLNENWRQLLFLYRSYKVVQSLRIVFENIERNYRRDWQKYIDDIGFDPLLLVWNVKEELKPRWTKGPTGKEANEWSEKYWEGLMRKALQNNRTYLEYLQYLHGFKTNSIMACAILGMVGKPSKYSGLRSLYHYAGLHVNKETGRAPRFEDYKKGRKRDFNSDLRAVLCGQLGPILTQTKSKYRKEYLKYRKYEDSRHDWETCESCQRVYKKSKKKTGKLHCYRRAVRKTVKLFLKDLWNYWKQDYAEP